MAGLLPAYEPGPVRIACGRETKEAIAESVKIALDHYIELLGLSDEFDSHNFTIDHENGSHMFFPGISATNVRGLLSLESVDVFWVEQAETAQAEWMRKLVPSIRKDGAEMWFSWNPDRRSGWAWRRFVLNRRPTDLHTHVNWHMNPWWYCSDRMNVERLEFKRLEPDLYPNEYLGVPDDGDSSKQVLSYGLLLKCVEAYAKGLKSSRRDAPITDVGLDIAEGGRDKCAQVIRVGPSVEFIDMWPGVAGDLSEAAGRAHSNTEGWDPYKLYYDASSPMMSEFTRLEVQYFVTAISFGGEVGGKDEFYEYLRTNEMVFRSRNIQMADALRLRANRTVRLLKGEDVDPNTCLFINPELPDLEGYLADMTQPIRRRNPMTGKWELDKRGGDEKAESPDRFDGTCLAYARDSENGLSVGY